MCIYIYTTYIYIIYIYRIYIYHIYIYHISCVYIQDTLLAFLRVGGGVDYRQDWIVIGSHTGAQRLLASGIGEAWASCLVWALSNMG